MIPRKQARAVVAGLTAVLALCLYVGWRRTGSQTPTYEAVANWVSSGHPNTPSTETRTPPSYNTSAPRILLVSALYPLGRAKHSHDDYKWWLGNFLSHITTDVYFFAPPVLEQTVQQARSVNRSKDAPFFMKLNTSYESAFSVPPLRGREEAYEEMHGKDREKNMHAPELYAIWNAKPFFLNEAAKEMKERWKREYDYVFWVDAGSFRIDHHYRDWPNPRTVEALFQTPAGPHPISFPLANIPTYRYRSWQEDMGPIDEDISEGSFFGGSPDAIEWYASTFYAYHDHYLSMGYFVGKDQTFINSILLLFPERFHYPLETRPPLTLPVLAARAMRKRVVLLRIYARERGRAAKNGRSVGRMARRVAEALVQRAFGPGWKRPQASAIWPGSKPDARTN
ncbi:hypothetical protein DFP72DRAFT_30509 [Ephemerocybe angulata]|uniref:Uncharacterized protein n=1 Tax=Ephemerocybe angulata TaxID=980116 RepID=A0A8H6MCQ4_9AGAR|nr:hypothetical protein DFP72DRAFT_30509 [Tulosesus angulatus]